MNLDKNLIGAAGEHLVLSRLLAKGILAAPAPRGTRKADILVNLIDTNHACLIQVKTRSGNGGRVSWTMGAKHEEITDEDLFYCFVDLSDDSPGIYVIPAKRVAEVIRQNHSRWLATPGKKGQAHNDSDMRKISYLVSDGNQDYAPAGWMDEYLENWNQILKYK